VIKLLALRGLMSQHQSERSERSERGERSERDSVYKSDEPYQRGLERIYSPNVRRISSLLVRSVREESQQVLAARL
jgi:hypothetical protein